MKLSTKSPVLNWHSLGFTIGLVLMLTFIVLFFTTGVVDLILLVLVGFAIAFVSGTGESIYERSPQPGETIYIHYVENIEKVKNTRGETETWMLLYTYSSEGILYNRRNPLL